MAVARSDKDDFRGTSDGLVRVNLQYIPQIPAGTRSARRNYLLTIFQNTAAQLNQFGIQLDMKSLAVSGQNLEATIPIHYYDEVATALMRADIRMNTAVERRATLT